MKAIEDVDIYMLGVSLLFGNSGGQWGDLMTRFQAQMRDAFRRVIDLRYLGSEKRTGELIY